MNKTDVVSSNRILYTPTAFARSSLLHLQEIGMLTALQAHTSSRSNLKSFLFLTVVSGEGVLDYDGETYTLYPGSCVLIDCMKPYAHSTAEGNLWTIQWIHFFGPTAYLIYDEYRERGGRPAFANGSQEFVFAIWEELMALASSLDHLRDMKINQKLAELLVVIMEKSECADDESSDSKRFVVEKIKGYLDGHYAEKISIENLSSRFLVSSSYLAYSFKAQYGVSVTGYLLSVRITYAKRLLRFSGKSVAEIGYEVGIGEPIYFSRVFKQVEGISPKQFREQW